MAKIFKGLLVCGLLLSLNTNTITALAEENTKESVTEVKESLGDSGFSVIKPTIEESILREKQARIHMGRKIYIDNSNYLTYDSYQNIVDEKVSPNRLEVGAILEVTDTAYVNDNLYFELSYKSGANSLGWVLSSDKLVSVSGDEMTKAKKHTQGKDFYTLTKDVETYTDVVTDTPRKLNATGELPLGTRFNLLETSNQKTLKEATNWYEISLSQTFDNYEEAVSYVKDSPLEIEKVIKNVKDNEGKEQELISYVVDIKGWIPQKDVKEVSKGLLTLSNNKVTLFTKPDNKSEISHVSKNNKDSWNIDSDKTVILENVETTWYKIQEIDSKGNVLKAKGTKYITEKYFKKTDYTLVEKETISEKEQLVVLTMDVETLDKPKGSKGFEKLNKLAKDSYYYTDKEIRAKTGKDISEWVELKNEDGKSLGLVEKELLTYPKGNRLEYTVKKGDTLESILKTFKLTKDEFEKMNIELAYLSDQEFKEGLVIVVKAPEVGYDTSNVQGTSSGITLVKDMMATSSTILDNQLLPSVAYAQALLESGGGTSGLSSSSNNLFGIKGTYKGQGSSWATNEDSGGGSLYTINATFRSYPNKMVSILDYVDLIANSGIYDRAIGITDPRDAIYAIWDSGYATDAFYVDKIMKMIDMYDLTQFDKV